TAALDAFIAAADARSSRRRSTETFDQQVRERLDSLTPEIARRRSAFHARKRLQAERLCLPLYPTTTIGSFPQTQEIRKARAAVQSGRMATLEYEAFLEE